MLVEYFAPFYSGGGYCSEAFAFAFAMTLYNMTFILRHHGDSHNRDFMDGLTIKERHLLEHNDGSLSYLPSFKKEQRKFTITICHSEPGAWYTPYPKYHTTRCPPTNANFKIGRTMFETDTIPNGWIERLNYMDEIWVPTIFSQNIFINNGVNASKIKIVGEPIDTDFYIPIDISTINLPNSSPLTSLIKFKNEDYLILLFCGKWENRKGVKILLKAFFNEFNENDKIILTIVTSAYHSTSDFLGEIKKTLLLESLVVTDKMLKKLIIMSSIPQTQMPILYNLANVLVIPSHGEGWGRPHVEAMSCGIPVIATFWSGPTEYLTNENGYPLNYTGLIATPGWEGHQWANPDVKHLQSLLRHIYKYPLEAKEKGKIARDDMISNYSLLKMGNIVFNEINRIHIYLANHVKKKARQPTAAYNREL